MGNPSTAHQPALPRPKYLVALMFGFSMMSYFDRTIMSIAGPEVMKELAISPTGMGAVYSAFLIAYALFMMPGGQLTDRIGPRLTLTLVGLAAGSLTALTALGGTAAPRALIGALPALVLIRFGFGVATAPLYPACARMCLSWIPAARQARVQGLIIAGSSTGAAISPLVFSWLMGLVRWPAAFCIAGGVTIALALVWFGHAREVPRVTAPAQVRADVAGAWKRLLTNRTLLLLTFAYGTASYFSYIFYYWIYYYFGEVRKMGLQRGAAYTSVLFLTMAAMMPLGGWISDVVTRRYGQPAGRRLVPCGAMICAALLLYLGTVTPGDVLTVLCMSLAIGFSAFCEGPFWAAVTEFGGDHAGAATSILNTGSNVAGAFAPLLTPWIASHAGWSWSLYSGALIMLCGAAACYLTATGPDLRTSPAAAPG
jgi:ACS family glucarate transporter-like MFS transporter